MKVVITGICSYLASEILPFLEEDEEIEEILGIDLVEPQFKSPKITFLYSDVRNSTLDQNLQGYDALIHLAFIVSPLKSVKEMYSINIEGSQNIFNCAIKAGIKKIIHASSVAAYGAFSDNPIPITEDHPIRLMKKTYYYHETKYKVEKYLDHLEENHPEVQIVRFRPHIFLGPTINNAFRDMYKTPKLYSFFPGDLTQYVWANDVAQAFYLALKKNVSGAFNLGAENPLTTYEIAKRLDKKVAKLPYKFSLFMLNLTYKLHLQRKVGPGWLRMARYPIIVDSTKAKMVLGWMPTHDTWQTLEAFLNHLKKIGELK